MKAADPSLRVIPTRWVETNKAEIGQPDVFKSRLVVRGDLGGFEPNENGLTYLQSDADFFDLGIECLQGH